MVLPQFFGERELWAAVPFAEALTSVVAGILLIAAIMKMKGDQPK